MLMGLRFLAMDRGLRFLAMDRGFAGALNSAASSLSRYELCQLPSAIVTVINRAH